MNKILQKLDQRPTLVAVLGWLGLGSVALIDYWTGNEIALSVFYLGPVFLVTLVQGFKGGYAASVVAATLWALADYLWAGNFAWYLPWNAAVRLAFFGLFVTLFSRLMESLRHEEELARIDDLTGIPNARAFYEESAREIARSRRHGRPLALAYVDCDNFKEVNDTFGHEAGDQILRVTAQIIQSVIRKSDFAARMGGDEFAILLPETDAEGATQLLQKLVETLAEAMLARSSPVTLSVGVAVYHEPPVPISQVLKEADDLMYQAKRAGKNRVVVQVQPVLPKK